MEQPLLVSQLTGRPLLDPSGERVATVRDLVVRMDDEPHPRVVGLLARWDRHDVFVPIDAVTLADDAVQLRPEAGLAGTGGMAEFARRDGEVLLEKEVLDKSVISLAERKVVRVNDLVIAREDDAYRLVAADVDLRGLLRRLLPGGVLGGWSETEMLDWSQVEYLAANTEVQLDLSHERLADLHPVEIAKLVDSLSYREGAEIVDSLDDATAADTLEEKTPERQADIVETLDEERAADILEETAPDDAADLLGDLPEATAEDLLERMDVEESEEVRELMAYPDHTAGGAMTNDLVAVPAGITAGEAIRLMRELAVKPDLIYYVYVVRSLEDPELLGVVSLRDLILAESEAPIESIMVADYLAIGPEEDNKKAARLIAEYNLMALPVVDERRRLLGIITVDDALELLLPDSWRRRVPRLFS